MNLPTNLRLYPLPLALILVGLLLTSCSATNGGMKKADIETQNRPIPVIQQNHTANIVDVTFSKSGKYILTGGRDHSVRMWNTKGKLIRKINTPDVVGTIDISDDERVILVGSYRNVLLYSTNGELLNNYGYTKTVIGSVKISPDNNTYAIGTRKIEKKNGYGILISIVDNTNTLLDDENYEFGIESIDFINSRLVAAGCSDGFIRIWETSGKLIHRIKSHDHPIDALAINRSKSIIASSGILNNKSGNETKIKLWSINGQLIREFPSHNTRSIHFSPTNDNIISAGIFSKKINTYSLKGDKLNEIKVSKYLSRSPTRISISPNGDIISIDSHHNPPHITLWNKQGERLLRFKNLIRKTLDVAYSPDGKTILASGSDGRIRIWNSNGTLEKVIKAQNGRVENVAFAPSGRYFVSTGKNILVWTKDGKRISEIPGHKRGIHSIAFSPDSRYIYSSGGDGYVNIFDIEDMKVHRRFKAHDFRVYDIAVHPSGKLFATSSERDFRIWDTNGALVASNKDRNGKQKTPLLTVFALTFNHDGSILTTRSSINKNSTLQNFDLKGNLISTKLFPHNSRNEGDISYSKDGRWLASSSGNNIIIWNLESGEIHRTLKSHNSTVSNLEFSSDGNHLVSSGLNANAIIWNVENGNYMTFLASSNGWISYTNRGFYTSSPRGGELLSFRKGNSSYDLGLFSAELNRPDIIKKEMGFHD